MKLNVVVGILSSIFISSYSLAQTAAKPPNGATTSGVVTAGASNAVGIAGALAANRSSADPETSDKNLRERVKKRQYPGGIDEEPLKVQSQMPMVSRKMGPTVEIEAPEPTETHQESD